MKYFVDFPGYTDCYIDVEEQWTLKELNELVATDEDNYFDVLRKKTLGIFLRDVDGNELRDVKKLDKDFVENIDVILAGFLGTVLVRHVRDRRSLGGLSVLPQSSTLERPTVKK
jgi:hypothetical protein